jgi:signal transduction histidine kinase/CheY-like chemotaxis protein
MTPSDTERIETGPLPVPAVFANCEYDFQSGRIVWTDGAESLFGTVPRTVDSFLEHVRAEDRDRVWSTMWRALSDRGPHDFEYPCIHLDGALRWHAWYGRPLFDGSGRARGLSALVLDVTHRRLTERARLEELAETQAARERAEGALRGNMAVAAVAHDLKTPLSAILGWAKTLQARRGDPDTVERAITAILRSARAQARLLDDLLDAERMARGKLVLRREWLSPGAVLRDAVETVQPESEDREVYLDVEAEPDLPALYGDSGRLTQVVWNLLSNAVKYSPPSSTVLVRLARSEDGVQLVVTDSGPGISGEALPHLFEPFWKGTADDQRGTGLGLGLSIARRLTLLHGGSLTVEGSGTGQGATFRLFLPAPAQDNAPAVTPVPTAPLPLSGVRILLVPDDAGAGQLLAGALRRAGAEVDLAEAGQALARARAARPDVLVTGHLGFGDPTRGLLGQVRAVAGLNLRGVALVDASRAADRARARREGYDGELARPVDSVDLIATVLRVLGRQSR